MPALLDRIEPQRARRTERPPRGGRWVYEIELDGYRLLAALGGHDVRLRSCNRVDWTHKFPRITEGLRSLDLRDTVVDGELCYVTERGRTSFRDLQRVLPRDHVTAGPEAQAHLIYFVFDLLFHDGEDLRARPLLERKARLRALLEAPRGTADAPGSEVPLLYSEHLEVDGPAAWAQACRSGLAGLIAKRVDAPYAGGRSSHWLKLECRRRRDFVIVGMTASSGRAAGVRSLLLAQREARGYRYCGKVDAGFDRSLAEDLAARLQALVVEDPPLRDPPREAEVTWVVPALVCEVECAGVTREGRVRRAVFRGLRLDKPAASVVRER